MATARSTNTTAPLNSSRIPDGTAPAPVVVVPAPVLRAARAAVVSPVIVVGVSDPSVFVRSAPPVVSAVVATAVGVAVLAADERALHVATSGQIVDRASVYSRSVLAP
jgi:hypothetical protein